MSFGDGLREAWPYLSTVATFGLVPFALWLRNRLDRQEERRAKAADLRAQREAEQEERRTKALEAIVPAIERLEISLGEKIDTMKTEILAAIRSEDIEEIKAEIRRTHSGETPAHGIQSTRKVQ